MPKGGGGNKWVRASRDAPSLGDYSLITTVSPMPQPHGSEHVVGCQYNGDMTSRGAEKYRVEMERERLPRRSVPRGGLSN